MLRLGNEVLSNEAIGWTKYKQKQKRPVTRSATFKAKSRLKKDRINEKMNNT